MKQVILMRKDLNMRKGKMIAQGAHACMGVLLKDICSRPHRWIFMIIYKTIMRRWPETNDFGRWLNEPYTKIVLGVNNLSHLEYYKFMVDAASLPHCLITDAGKTEFHGEPTITCMAVGPGPNDQIDQITGQLELL